MSRLFGSLRQMGYVVTDVDGAMKHWIEVCGVGPWFYADRLPLTSFSYAGQRHDDIHVTIALANSGEMQLELIQQRSEHPSMYRDFLAANPHGGLQHWSSWPENYDELYRRALANGYRIGQEGDAPRGRFVYFHNEGHPGTIIGDVARHADAPPHLRRGARGSGGMARARSDPHRLADITVSAETPAPARRARTQPGKVGLRQSPHSPRPPPALADIARRAAHGGSYRCDAGRTRPTQRIRTRLSWSTQLIAVLGSFTAGEMARKP